MPSFAVLGMLAISCLVAACGGSSGSNTLTIYSGRSESLVAPIIQQFGESSGANVLVKYADTPQLAATLLEEGERTPADVFFAQDPGGLGAVEHMLSQLPEDLLSLAPEWAKSPSGRWIGLSGRARTVVYNTENLTEADLPDDIFDFVDSKWRGRIGWAPTNASFQTMVSAMRGIWGDDKTRQWIEGIKDNEPKAYPKNTPIVAAAASGEIDVGFVNHYYLHRFLAEEGEGFQARNYHPRAGGPGSIIMVAGAGVLSSSDNEVLAQRFLKFLLSPPAQSYFARETFEYPLISGIPAQGGQVPISEFAHPDVPVAVLADLETTQALLRSTGILP
ncbi:MAG: iron ABC transporter substrate-binding protein [SAR202 cluster bacterium Io17-Chloro-G4]|nr:MAG: iron ABC transporter substrate-binding protein [SAR202 cluster bacterium Io17-Chloro-G4]